MMQTRQIVRWLTGAFLALLLTGSPAAERALGDATTYATARRQVRCGVVVCSALDYTFNNASGTTVTAPENTGTHIFYILDSRTDLKPSGLEFVNPMAPPVVTGDIYSRWQSRVRSGAYDPAFDSSSNASRLFQVGSKITKNMGPYWEVNLDTISTDDIKNYDLLYIHSHRQNTAFTPDQREKLRKFMEAGGTVWLENSGQMTMSANAPFIYDIQFGNGYTTDSGAVIATANHPLLSSPYQLTPQELQNIGDKSVGQFYIYNLQGNADAQNPPARTGMVPVVWNNRSFGPLGSNGQQLPNPKWRPYIMAGQVGAGRIIVSAQDSGDAINNYVGGNNAGWGVNSAVFSGEGLLGAHPVDLKFVYNMATWATAHTTANTDPRRSGGTSEKIGAVLSDKWQARSSGGAGVDSSVKVGGAVQYKFCTFSVDSFDATWNISTGGPVGTTPGKLFLHCYDSQPQRDLDGDGNNDDGMQDLIAGAPYDQVWQLELTQYGSGVTGASTPTVFEFYDPNGSSLNGGGLASFNQREMVVVVLSDGTVLGVRAFPRQNAPNLPLAGFTVVDWKLNLGQSYGSAANMPIPAAAYLEGVVFASVNTGNGGRLLAIDPATGNAAFDTSSPITVSPARGAIPDSVGMPPFIGTPTVGYVRDEASGASDKVIYVLCDGTNTPRIPQTIRSFWFGTKDEPLTLLGQAPSAPGAYQFASRSQQLPWYGTDGITPVLNFELRPRVYWQYRSPSGRVYSKELQYLTGATPNTDSFVVTYVPAQGTRILIGAVTPPAAVAPDAPGSIPSAPNAENVTFYADYTLDWIQSDPTKPKVNARNVFIAPDPQNNGTQITGAPALSPDDLAYYNVSINGTQAQSVLFGVLEQTGQRTLNKWTYTFHNGFTFNVNGQNVTVPPRLRQLDKRIASETGTNVGDYILNMKFVGSPAYRNGVTYATAIGTIGSSGKGVSVLCAFTANKDLVLRLNGNIAQGTPVRLQQANLFDPSGNTALRDIPNTCYTVDYNAGLIRLTSMSTPGTVTNFATTSIPFVVTVGNGQSQVIAATQVDTINGNREARLTGAAGVDNLLWYTVLPSNVNAQNVGGVVSGPSIQDTVAWMSFYDPSSAQYPAGRTMIVSVDADPGSSDPSAQASGAQAMTYVQTATTSSDLLHLRWVQAAGAGPTLAPPVATGGLLTVNTVGGLNALEDTLTVVADSKRILEVNAAGEATWSSDGTRSFGTVGGPLDNTDGQTNNPNATGRTAVQNVPFARPSTVRRLTSNEFLIVDTGNNRVVQIDRGGNIQWEVSKINDDYKQVTRPGDPLTLNEPTDCQYWTEFLPRLTFSVVRDGTTYGYDGPATLVHYLIADTGNFRVVELVDVYDANGVPVVPKNGGNAAPFQMLRQINFVSSTYSNQGKKLRYRSVQRLLLRNGDLPAEWRDPAKGATDPVRLTLSAVANYRQVGDPNVARQAVNAGGDISETGGGSLVLLNEQGTPLSIVSDLRIPIKRNPDPTKQADYRTQPIVNPTFYSVFQEVVNVGGTPTLYNKYLLADQNGCYQLTTGPDPKYLDVEWYLSAEDYYRMTGKRLQASSLKRLTNSVTDNTQPGYGLHHYLITNRFSGQDNPRVFGVPYNTSGNPANGNLSGPNEFFGEVFEVDPTFFSFDLNAPAQRHGYAPDYIPDTRDNRFLIKNPQASIVFRTPTESLSYTFSPAGTYPIGTRPSPILRYIGDTNRATSTSLLEQPAFADRPF